MAKKKSSSTRYKTGSINGIKTQNASSKKARIAAKKKKQEEEFYGYVKMLCGLLVILVMVFVVNAVFRANVKPEMIYYDEPEESEVIEIVSSSTNQEQPERVNLNLLGDLVVSIKLGEKYVEPGYNATSDLKGDISEFVKVEGEIDNKKVGTYKLTYILDYRGINPKLTRLVNVVDGETSGDKPNNDSSPKPSTKPSSSPSSKPSAKPSTKPSESPKPSTNPSTSPSVSPSTSPSPSVSPSPSSKPESGNITLTLNGNSIVYVSEGSTYKELGAKAIDNKGKDLSDQITISGSVNTNEAGTYRITYSIKNYNGDILTVIRNVVVQNMGITLTVNTREVTNKAVTITINANVDDFSNIVLPSGERVEEKVYNYKVSKNGTYEFIVYNKNGEYRKASMVIDNIDKEKPRASCKITDSGNGSIVTVNATDNVKISYYLYSGTRYDSNVINFERRIESGLTINVLVYDVAGNFVTCNCKAP